ncbi:nucleotide pyrophosphohydrolase [Candidatus Gracilibacteria bacterium]|nr:nucleotide pyrophosphohydrolase [Candidatus Gracilibacteria bacterium]
MQEITLKQSQKIVDDWIKTVGVRYFSELTNLGQLTEEVGEVARIMIRQYGEQSCKKSDIDADLGDEIADVLFVLICIANQTGIDLTEKFHKNMEKKNIRDKDRHKNNAKLQEKGEKSKEKEKFESWNILKQNINTENTIPFFREGQVWYISMGKNISFEQDGKGKSFQRPILVLKKFSKDIFLGIPTTTKQKTGKFYFDIGNIGKHKNSLILSQIKLYSSKRLLSHIGGINKIMLTEIKQKINELIQ